MHDSRQITVDANEAVASVAYRTNEVIAIYPITPATPMGELADAWSVHRLPNLWGNVPQVTEMQSEGGAAGAVHGALQAGALTTTFTASQGLLLMLPNLYKIAGELTPFCMHVAARTVATHALSIFGDHSDVMACRQTGFALLASGSVQEAHDFACIGQAVSLRSRVPFLHFFDGFRTSHEIQKIDALSDDALRMMIDAEAVESHSRRALTPDRPVLRGTAQNPDTFFQAREASNRFHAACPGAVQSEMDRFAELTGRRYRLFDYVGDPGATRVVVIMGSGAETVHETVERLRAEGEKVGVVKVRLYRPFDAEAFLAALPATVRGIAVLDRTKEPGSIGEPLYMDVVTALREAEARGSTPFAEPPRVIGGRYGLSSKEFDPPMVKAVLDELSAPGPRNHFTVGIVDDVTHASLPVNGWRAEDDSVFEAVFYGLGADGTVGANKNSIKIIGEETPQHVQGYFVYDSKKSGAMTVSHLRFGPRPIRSAYLIREAGFLACHQFQFLEKHDVLRGVRRGGTLLLNVPGPPEQVWEKLPREVQEAIQEKDLAVHAIDAYAIAGRHGLGRRINTIMQVCFFELTGLLDRETAIERIKDAIRKDYGKKGEVIVKRNFAAVDASLDHLHRIQVPSDPPTSAPREPVVPAGAPEFVQRITAVMLEGNGDLLPVSAFPVDGTWPLGTSRWEKRAIAQKVPRWDPDICIQCNKCALVCPHASIRAKAYEPAALEGAPAGFRSTGFRSRETPGLQYTIQLAPDDCTGCTLCFEVCPAKDKANPSHKALEMVPVGPVRDTERESFAFFLDLPEMDRTLLTRRDVKNTQFFEPLFEFSGACAGCGETPYLKLLTQLFGDRLLIANATGCSSIYGGNLPTTPYSVNREGRGPAWSNSLFEDNAEFGLGFRLAIDAQAGQARRLLTTLAPEVGGDLVSAILEADQSDEAGIAAQRERIGILRDRLADLDTDRSRRLHFLADYLVQKSVWLVGGDGWAYDIGYGGLDHVLGQHRNVNVLVLDTEVYSNTGGQASKATPLGAVAKFAMAGKDMAKKDLGMEAMSYRGVYVARIAFGAKDTQTVQALLEADAHPGPSLVIAYSHCIAHGYDLAHGLGQQSLAVASGAWPLYRYDPRRAEEGLPPLRLDSKAPTVSISEYMRNEARFRMAERMNPQRFARLLATARRQAGEQYRLYEELAGINVSGAEPVPEDKPKKVRS